MGWLLVIIGHRSSKSSFVANNTKFCEEVLFSISHHYKTTAIVPIELWHNMLRIEIFYSVYNFQISFSEWIWLLARTDDFYLILVSLDVNVNTGHTRWPHKATWSWPVLMQGRLGKIWSVWPKNTLLDTKALRSIKRSTLHGLRIILAPRSRRHEEDQANAKKADSEAWGGGR